MPIQNPSNLDAALHPAAKNLDGLFQMNFEIPYNQRGWAWGSDLLNRYWKDVVDTVNLVYDATTWNLRVPAPDPHFFGTVIVEKHSGIHRIQDGQQRITSTLLFMVCICDELEELRPSVAGNHALLTDIAIAQQAIKNKIFSGATPKIKADPTISQFFEGYFIFPANKSDRSSYLNANLGAVKGRMNLEKLLKDFKHATDLVGREVGKQSSPTGKYSILTACFNTMMFAFDCIVVEIAKPDRVTAIFKSLNEGGKILNAADLIKNQLFHISAPANHGQVSGAWQTLGTQRSDFVEFFKIWFYSSDDYVSLNQLYPSIQKGYLNHQANSQAHIPALANWVADSARLAWIEGRIQAPPSSDAIHLSAAMASDISRLHSELADLDVGLAYIVALAAYKKYFINSSQLSTNDRAAFYGKAIRYTIAASFRCISFGKMKSNQFASAMSRVARNIRAITVPVPGTPQYWKQVWGPINALPESADSVFSQAISSYSKYKNDSKTYYILSKLELFSGGNELLISKWSTIRSGAGRRNHIEHIMPQGKNTSSKPGWAHVAGYHAQLKGSLGNLIILDNNLNVKIGSKSLHDKQRVGYKICGLKLVGHIDGTTLAPFNGNKPITTWSDIEIKARATWLGSIACAAWPLP
jgi:hypothetical protein